MTRKLILLSFVVALMALAQFVIAQSNRTYNILSDDNINTPCYPRPSQIAYLPKSECVVSPMIKTPHTAIGETVIYLDEGVYSPFPLAQSDMVVSANYYWANPYRTNPPRLNDLQNNLRGNFCNSPFMLACQ